MLKTICLFYKQSVYSMIQHTIVMYCCHTYMLHWNDYKIILRQLKRRHYYQYYFVFHFLCKTLWNAAYYVKCFITHQVYAIILIKLVWIKKKDWRFLRSRKSNDRQYNVKTKGKRTMSGRSYTTEKTECQAPPPPPPRIKLGVPQVLFII